MPLEHEEGCEIDSETKNQFIGAVNAGQKVAQAARHYGIKTSTARNITAKFRNTGSVKNLPRSGRPRALTSADKRHLIRAVRKERRKPLAKVGNALGLNVSVQTLRNALKEKNYHRRIARKVPLLTNRHRILRMSWARIYRSFKREHWKKVIWTDETYIYLGDDRRRIFVTRQPEEEFLEECLEPTIKQASLHVMVWGCIMEGRKGPLVVLDYPGGKGGGMNTKGILNKFWKGS